MCFDYGILNLPFAKRQGNIDAQIDKYKPDKAREAKATHKAATSLMAVQRIEAQHIVAAIPKEL